MENEVFKTALTQGAWATLAVSLIFYILRAQDKRDIRQDAREAKYQEIIHNIAEQLNIVKELKEDVEKIKNYIIKN